MAVELIFQIGDKEFWDKNPNKRRKMDVAFKEMLDMLQKEAPNLVVANAVYIMMRQAHTCTWWQFP